ncbi:excalibur calcium-binding domain-containing protein [Mesorhizobium sp. 1B3]|uniref:excalibur calcium-binding domain-containing protein n=1 Tax=Mesorhizobium sp. 1B3 TaxID=3243599 RepID=UPI003D96722D
MVRGKAAGGGAHILNIEAAARRRRHRRWAERWSHLKRPLSRFGFAVAMISVVALILWKPLQSVRISSIGDAFWHLAASPNCTAARAVGLAPARRGQPGYWPSHDADNDGIASKPYFRYVGHRR